jgi:hypothetical protein
VTAGAVRSNEITGALDPLHDRSKVCRWAESHALVHAIECACAVIEIDAGKYSAASATLRERHDYALRAFEGATQRKEQPLFYERRQRHTTARCLPASALDQRFIETNGRAHMAKHT